MTSTLAILGRFSGDKAKALAYCDDLIATYSQCREDIAQADQGAQASATAVLYQAQDFAAEDALWDERRASVTDADYRW